MKRLGQKSNVFAGTGLERDVQTVLRLLSLEKTSNGVSGFEKALKSAICSLGKEMSSVPLS